MAGILAITGIGMLLAVPGQERSALAEQAKERSLATLVADERREIKRLARANARRELAVRRLRREISPLAQARSDARAAAETEAREAASADAYPDGYLDAFPSILRDGDEWLIVHDTADTIDAWTADEAHEYQIQEGEVYAYAPGEAPPVSNYGDSYGINPDGTEGYVNADGEWVPSPSSNPNLEPGGPTALCADGTYSYSRNRSGTCSHHGGVASWYP